MGRFRFLGVYLRKLLPEQLPLGIPRVRCKQCLATHAVLPAFLMGYIRYPTSTLAVYFEQAVENSRRPIETWSQDLADGPQSFETLYRWLRRLRPRLAALLPLLKSELLTLNPACDFSPLQNVILKSKFKETSSQQDEEDQSSQSPKATAQSPPAMLSIVALCAITYWLSRQVLQLAGELLKVPHGGSLSPVTFLNYFAWQKTGLALLSPPVSSRSP